jgi:hypothetical protein
MTHRMSSPLALTGVLALAFSGLISARAAAQPPTQQPESAPAGVDSQSGTAPVGPVPITAAPPSPKAPYSLPFQLRPAQAVTVLRTDTSFAFYDDPVSEAEGTTIASTLLASYKVTDNISPLVRVGMVSNSPPNTDGAANFLNPVLGVTYGMTLSPELRLALFVGAALPFGSGGGDSPDPAKIASNAAGIRARSAMDNAMFAVNDLVLFPGASVAYVAHGLTVQFEATLLQLMRVRGEDAVNAAGGQINPDSSRTNFTAGLHVGYFVFPELSGAVELRHQRWLSTPAAVEADTTDTLRDTTTVAIGPRLHFKVGEKTWIRPALALAFGLDDPLQRWESRSVQLDIPVIF